jgi:hypothetical protein
MNALPIPVAILTGFLVRQNLAAQFLLKDGCCPTPPSSSMSLAMSLDHLLLKNPTAHHRAGVGLPVLHHPRRSHRHHE